MPGKERQERQGLNRASGNGLPARLSKVLTAELGDDPRAHELFDGLLESARHRRHFCAELIRSARGELGDSWPVRRLAALMLQHQVAKIPADKLAELDAILVRLKLKPAAGLDVELDASVLTEGYTTTRLADFASELRRRLARHARVFARIQGKKTSQRGLRDFIRLSRQDCKLALARYLFAPADVVDRIFEQLDTGMGVHTNIPTDDELRSALSRLPGYEAAIVEQLLATSRTFWVSATTSSRLNALVEYPLGTVVLVVKPPGSEIELELKRAGLRGKHPITVAFRWPDGEAKPAEHRFQGVSATRNLEFEARASLRLSTIYRRVHGREAPIPSFISILSKYTVPVEGGEEFVFDYLTDSRAFGEGFRDMRASLRDSVAAFDKTWKWPMEGLAGEPGLTARFITYLPPAQAMLAGTTSFRLDVLARYLSSGGARHFFEDGLGIGHTKDEDRWLAGDLLEQALGVFVAPKARSGDYDRYLEEAMALPQNRARADDCFRSAMGQLGTFWGTLLAIRGYSKGESFVARNVGLRSWFGDGRWQIQVVFMDHDNLHILPSDARQFSPPDSLRGMALDEIYLFGLESPGEPTRGSVECLADIYRADAGLVEEGRAALLEALELAYEKTHLAVAKGPGLHELFSERFVERLRDWDNLVAGYLRARADPAGVEPWKATAEAYLRERGYDETTTGRHLAALAEHAELLERYAFLYDGRR